MSETANINYLEIINRFCATSEGRHSMLVPFRQGDHVYATDGAWAARIAAELVPTIGVVEGAPDARKVFAGFKPSGKLIPIEKYDLPECRKCGGMGWWICSECEHEHECQECDEPVPSSYGNPDREIRLDARRANKLLELGFTRIELHADHPKRCPVRAVSGGVEVLLMPVGHV